MKSGCVVQIFRVPGAAPVCAPVEQRLPGLDDLRLGKVVVVPQLRDGRVVAQQVHVQHHQDAGLFGRDDDSLEHVAGRLALKVSRQRVRG